MDQLLQGYARFRRDFWPHNRAHFAAMAQHGQSPSTMVVGCCDSRVPPEVVFDCAPGDIFVVRSVANLIPTYAPDSAYHGTSAALEFAVKGLRVSKLVVLGHSRCGGIRALMEGASADATDFIGPWMGIADEARRRARAALEDAGDLDAACRLCERESIRVSLTNLATFPWIAERVAAGELELGGFLFDVETGELERIEPSAG